MFKSKNRFEILVEDDEDEEELQKIIKEDEEEIENQLKNFEQKIDHLRPNFKNSYDDPNQQKKKKKSFISSTRSSLESNDTTLTTDDDQEESNTTESDQAMHSDLTIDFNNPQEYPTHPRESDDLLRANLMGPNIHEQQYNENQNEGMISQKPSRVPMKRVLTPVKIQMPEPLSQSQIRSMNNNNNVDEKNNNNENMENLHHMNYNQIRRNQGLRNANLTSLCCSCVPIRKGVLLIGVLAFILAIGCFINVSFVFGTCYLVISMLILYGAYYKYTLILNLSFWLGLLLSGLLLWVYIYWTFWYFAHYAAKDALLITIAMVLEVLIHGYFIYVIDTYRRNLLVVEKMKEIQLIEMYQNNEDNLQIHGEKQNNQLVQEYNVELR